MFNDLVFTGVLGSIFIELLDEIPKSRLINSVLFIFSGSANNSSGLIVSQLLHYRM